MLTCLDALPKNHREEIVAKQRKLIAFVRDALQDMRPETPGDRYANVDAMLFLGMINWTYTWYGADGSISPEDLATRAADIFISGYLALWKACLQLWMQQTASPPYSGSEFFPSSRRPPPLPPGPMFL